MALTMVLAAFVVFTLFNLILTGVLVGIRNLIMKRGLVTINLNDGFKVINVPQGNSLLQTLVNAGIFVPSACGGKGTCYACKVRVLEGGGNILPTELPAFTKKQIKDNWRLSCQVKVKEPLKIIVPDEVLTIKEYITTVRSNRNVATYIKELVLELPPGETLKFKPGGYIQIYIPHYSIDFSKDIHVEDEFKDEWDKYNLWKLKVSNDTEIFRAYSMANHPAEGNIVMLNVRIATPPWDKTKNDWAPVPPGIASSYIFSLKPGDKVKISGPYGEFHIKNTNREMIYIGGGAGMAPLRSHIFHLFHTLKTTRKVSYFYGGRSKRELFYVDDFRKIEQQFPNFKFVIALSEPKPEDNWTGPVGFIHQVTYDLYLKNHPAPEDIEYYLCGPPPMIDAVLKMLDALGVPPENIAYDKF